MAQEIRLSNQVFISSKESLNHEISWLYQVLPFLEMTDPSRQLENQGTDLVRSLRKTQDALEDFQFKLNSILFDLLEEVEFNYEEGQRIETFLEVDFPASLF